MIKINLVCVGNLKEKYLKEAVAEYSKRLTAYCSLTITELQEERLNDSEAAVTKAEGVRILNKLSPKDFVVALDICGKQMSSEKFAQFIDDTATNGVSSIAFVIGGSLGLGGDVLRRANFRLSFSMMTFPHQLMRVVLLEQVYRGFRIGKGEPYHK